MACNTIANDIKEYLENKNVTFSHKKHHQMLQIIADRPDVYAIVTQSYFNVFLANEFQQMEGKELIGKYGSDQFRWRMSKEDMGFIFNVLIMRKFGPMRNAINLNIMRILEGKLLSMGDAINLMPENRNPNR